MQKNIGRLYVDKHGTLRQVLQDFPNGTVRGGNVSNMLIDGILVTDELNSLFSGMWYDDKRNKVNWVE